MEEFWQEETRRNQVVEKSRSAYMIIYERINKLDSGSEGVEVTPSNGINSGSSLDKYNSLESTYQQIKEDNALLEHHKRIFEPDYFNFIKETLLFPSLEWTDSEEVVLEKAKLAFFFYFDVVARSKERHITLQFATTFVRMLQHNQTVSSRIVVLLLLFSSSSLY
jgi:hypothetical protein